MKEKVLRFIFILIVLVIISFAIFKIYEEKNEKISEQDLHYEKETMITSLRLGIPEYDNINPLISNNREIINISPIIYEPLFTLDKTYKLQECLAKEYSKLSNTCYVIKLKDNIKWQDGTAFTTEDVIFTIDKIKQLSNSVYYANVENIKNIENVDSNTIKINLNKEQPFFQYELIFPILSSYQYKKEDFSNSIPTGTGMYKVTKNDANMIELEKNNNWRNIETQNAKIEKIKIYKYASVGELYNNFKLGNIDFINTTNTNIQEYIGTIGFNLREYQGRGYNYLALNCNNKVLANKEVRQAINYAIDKNTIISKELSNNYFASNFILDYGSYLYQGNEENSYNPKKAKEILEKAGWKLNYGTWQKDGMTIELKLVVSAENEARVKASNIIKEQLEEIGIKVYIDAVQQNRYDLYLKDKNYDIIFTGIYNSYSHNITTLYGVNNLANYRNEEIVELIENINNSTDETIIKEKYNNLEKIAQEDLPYISLYRNKNIVVYSSNLLGEITPNNYTCYYNIETWYRQ